MKKLDLDEYPFKERRSGKDRRARPTSPFSRESFLGTRKSSRRKEDQNKHYFVDLYSPSFMVLLTFTMILSITDAFLTMKLVHQNCEELNPVMDYFLKLGPVPFTLAKCALTTFGLTTLLVLKNYYLWGKFKTVGLLVALPVLYLFLIFYEIALVMAL